MRDVLPQNSEAGMKWFDYYYRAIALTLVVVRSLSVIANIGRKNYIAVIVTAISAFLNISIMYLFRPYKKNVVRKYPKKIFYLTILDNAMLLIHTTFMFALYCFYGLSQYYSAFVVICVLYALNIAYFFKRKKYFGIEKIKSIDNSNKESVDIPGATNENSNSENNVLPENELLFCRKCGVKLPLDSDFCTKCGTKVIR